MKKEKKESIVLEVQNLKHNLNVSFSHNKKEITNIKKEDKEIEDGEINS